MTLTRRGRRALALLIASVLALTAPPTHAETPTRAHVEAAYAAYQRARAAGDADQALIHAGLALAAARECGCTTAAELAILEGHVALVHMELGRYALAEKQLLQVLATLEQELGPDHPITAAAAQNLAVLYEAILDYDRAEPLYRRALAAIEKAHGRDHPDVAHVAHSLAAMYEAKGDATRAKRLFQRALVTKQHALGRHHPSTLLTVRALARVHTAAGDHARPRPSTRGNLEAAEATADPDHPDTARAANALAVNQLHRGELAAAERLLERALAIREAALGPDHPDTAATVQNLAGARLQRGDYPAAERLYLRALAAREKAFGVDHAETGGTLHGLAAVYLIMGDFERAKAMYERALVVKKKALGTSDPSTLLTVHDLAGVYEHLGDLRRAEALYQHALTEQSARLGPDHPRAALTAHNLGGVYERMGDHARAERLYRRALAAFERALGADHPQTANALNSLAGLYAGQGDLDRAEPMYQRALAAHERALGPDHPTTARVAANLATAYRARGDDARALAMTQRVLAVEEATLGGVLAVSPRRRRLTYLRTLRGSTFAAVSLLTREQPDSPAALALATEVVLRRKGRALTAGAASIASLRARADDVDRASLDALEARYRQQAALAWGAAEDIVADRRAALAREIEALEGQLARSSAPFAAARAPITLDAVKAKLAPDEALIEWLVYRPFDPRVPPARRWGEARYVVFVLRRAAAPRWVDLGPAAAIDAAAKRFRQAVAARADVATPGRALDALAMAKVRPLLGDAARLTLSPDGALSLVPFAALVDEDGRYLIERFELRHVTSGRELLTTPPPAASGPPLLVGGVDFDARPGDPAGRADPSVSGERSADMSALGAFAALPGTATEIARLRALPLFDGATVLGAGAATERAVKAARAPRIVHLATHGFFLPDRTVAALADEASLARAEEPLLRSGVVLAGVNGRGRTPAGADDGVLTALEVASLPLWGTEIVALSACETGVGDVETGEGVFGLRRALALAGARTLLVSLWKVADEATQQLMVAWYRQLDAGVARADALRQIQLAAIAGKPLPVSGTPLAERGAMAVGVAGQPADATHPYYWASFIVSGEAGPLPAAAR